MNQKSKLWVGLPFVAAIALLVALYWGTFAWWVHEWTYPGSFYAHAMFVPFFVAIMVWRNRERLTLARWEPTWFGLAPLGLAMLLLMLGQRLEVTTIQSLSFIFLLFGITLLTLGWAKTRVLLFPLCFVIMMMPLIPDQLINGIAFPIQLMSARIATALLNILQLHSAQQGTMIQMESYRMAVELPCSGFKTLVSLLTFAAAFAYLVEGATWKRWTLFLATVPLSLFINALRITFIGIVGEIFSAHAASSFHDYSGFIVLILAFTFLFNFARVLRCDRFLGLPLNDDDPALPADTEIDAEAEPTPHEPAWWQEILAWRLSPAQVLRSLPYVTILALSLGLSLALKGMVTAKAPQQNPIATFQVPESFSANGVTWKALGTTQSQDVLPKEIQEFLNPIRVIDRDYNGTDGSQIHFFLTAGSGRHVFHDPHLCLIGSNSTPQDVGEFDVRTPRGETIRVLETLFKLADTTDTYEMMFCYVVQGQVVQRTEQVRTLMIKQTLLGDAGMPSYFFRVTQRLPGTEATKKAQIKAFIAGMWNQIGPILSGQQKGLPQKFANEVTGASPKPAPAN